MRNRLIALLTVLALGFGLPPAAMANGGPEAAAVPPAPAAPAGSCAPYFPLKDGWLGGDAAYSVELPGGRVLWLFGDTFIGAQDAGTRREAALIANSIALSACRDGRWLLDYFWRQGDEGPAAMFIPPDAAATTHEVRYWPLDGFVHAGAAYVFLSRVRTTDADSPLGFAIEGVDLARIDGLERPPAQWRITYRPVLRGEPALPGAAVLVQGDHALLYTPLTGDAWKARPLTLARLKLDRLNAPAEHLEFLAREGAWQRGFDAAHARRIMPEGATELSVHRAQGDGRFVAVLNEAAFPADRIVLRTAPAPQGPWTEETAVELIPERAGARGARRARVFCYAGKAYEPASAGTTLMLTYVCNSTDAELLLNDLRLYRPRVKRVTLPGPP